MTNTKFRKRALLSSVAMLLVALVALGSATFAWFAANPNAEAHGISMKTTAGAGLVIRTETDQTWSHSAQFNKNNAHGATINATPVSMDQTTTSLWTVVADNDSSYVAKSGESMTTASNYTDFYKEDIYCRLSTGSDTAANASREVKITGVQITANADAEMENTMRVAIARGTTLLGTWALNVGGEHGQLTGTTQTSSSTWTGGLNVAAASFQTPVPTGLTGLSANASDTSKALTVWVYMDGQDEGCKSDAVTTYDASEIISSVTVNLTLAS